MESASDLVMGIHHVPADTDQAKQRTPDSSIDRRTPLNLTATKQGGLAAVLILT
jgi:hypothetical protein